MFLFFYIFSDTIEQFYTYNCIMYGFGYTFQFSQMIEKRSSSQLGAFLFVKINFFIFAQKKIMK